MSEMNLREPQDAQSSPLRTLEAARCLGLLAEQLIRKSPKEVNRQLLDHIIGTLRDGEKALVEANQEIRFLKLPIHTSYQEPSKGAITPKES